ncbi:HPr kinase/phosphorylase [Rhodovarius crocodyli]|nr:aldolase [Rhodovarius crocodyli]
MRLHASCVSLRGAAVLLLGAPGAGKSSLALRLMGNGWSLVADDRVVLEAREGALYAAAPAEGAGLLEIRGLGIYEGLEHAGAPVALVAELTPAAAIPRLPEPRCWQALGIEVPRCALDATDPAAVEKAAWALAAATGRHRMRAGFLAQ